MENYSMMIFYLAIILLTLIPLLLFLIWMNEVEIVDRILVNFGKFVFVLIVFSMFKFYDAIYYISFLRWAIFHFSFFIFFIGFLLVSIGCKESDLTLYTIVCIILLSVLILLAVVRPLFLGF